jgi:hypothetical protein
MDLTTFSPPCFQTFRTALRTAETLDLVVGIPEVGFLQYAYTARKPHSEKDLAVRTSQSQLRHELDGNSFESRAEEEYDAPV